jgi:putative PEP-CTERM system TPR-repeat lipoprotein
MKHRPFGPSGRFVLLAALLTAVAPSALGAADPKASRYYEDALIRYEKKDLAGAIIQLKNALQIDKNQLPAQMLLGKALLQKGDVIAAEVAFNEALRLGVNRTEIVVPLAHTYVALGKQKQLLSEATFNTVGLPREIQLELTLLRASASADIGDSRGALQSIDDARALDPRSARSYLAEVPIRIRGAQLREADQAADRALALAPDSAEASYQKGTVLHQKGALKDALAQYDKAIRTDKGHVEARIARAGLLIDFNRADDAAKDLGELATSAPQEPRAAYLRALLAERGNRPADVTKALREVTSLLDPAPPNLLQYRPQLLLLNGLAHFGLNEPAKAKPLLESLQRLQGTSPASKLLAQLYVADREAAKAIPVLEAYLKTSSSDVEAINLLASAHMAEGHDYKATALMQEAIRTTDTPALRSTLGLSLIKAGRASDALSHLENAFRKDNTRTQAGTALVGLYLQARQGAKAVTVAETIARNNPNAAAYQNLLGLAYGGAGRYDDARKAFEKAVQIDDRFVPAKVNLARLDLLTNRLDAAEQRLNALIKENERNVDALMEMAALAEARRQAPEVLRWTQKAADLEGPRAAAARLSLFDLHLRQRRPKEALEAAKQAASKLPENVEAKLALATAFLANGDKASARNELITATRIAEYDADRQVRIARLQIAAANLPGASYSLEKALAGSPDHLPAQVLSAETALLQGDFPNAEKFARAAVDKHPKSAAGHLATGEIALARGKKSAALDAYRRAHQVEPSSTTVLRLFGLLAQQDRGKPAFQLADQWLKGHAKDALVARAVADLHASHGNFLAARKAYEFLLKIAPDDAASMNNLANVLLRLKDPGAAAMAEAALAKEPGDANIIDTLGWILLQRGDLDRALQLLRDARLRSPDNPEIRYHLAEALSRSNRSQEAREELQAALKSTRKFEQRPAAESLLRKLGG